MFPRNGASCLFASVCFEISVQRMTAFMFGGVMSWGFMSSGIVYPLQHIQYY